MRPTLRWCLGLTLCLAALTGTALAQESAAELRGRALDPQGAAISGATLTITNQATGVYRQSVTGDDGAYFVTALSPGLYTLVAESPGFKKYSRADIRLDLGRTTTLDLPLEIGGLAETVTITADTPLVDVTSKEIGGNVTNREVTSLPSVNGNFVGMVALLPGIVANVSTESFGSDAVSANGMDSRNNNFLLDGANNNDDVIGQRAGSQARTPLEAIAEFQVITNQYDAEFGRTTGAIVNAITKSGSNQLHGVGAGLWQDASMTQRDFFVKQNNLTKPDTQLQTYRANIGGPIIRDKAHAFFNVERVMVNRANSISIPSHPELNASPVTKDRVWNTLLRVDHQLSRNSTWTVRWLRESSPQLNQVIPYQPPFAGAQLLTSSARASREESDVDQTVVVSANTVLSNTRLNTVRFNFTQEDVAFANPGFNGNGQDQAALDPLLVFLTFVDQQSNLAQARVNDAYQIDDTMSWFITGRGGEHDVKFGAQYEYVGARSTAQDNLNGTFFFRSDAPFNAANPSTYPERLQIRVPGGLNSYQKAHFGSAFAQDKWRLTPRTTLSVGLRYDIEVQPFYERDNPAFPDPTAYPVDKNNLAPRLGLTYDLSGNGRAVARGGYGRFYDKTHFELISAILTAGVFSDSFQVFFPTNNADPGPSSGTLPTEAMLAGGPTVNRALLEQRYPPGSRVKNTGNVTLDNPDRTIPYSDQITAGYERQVGSSMSVSADYVHARARDQLMLRDLNPGLRATTARTSTLTRINSPAFSASVFTPVNEGEIDYDALEAALVKRFGAGYSFRVSYTLGSSRGNTSGLFIPTSGFQVLEDLNLDMNEGPTNFDRRHNLVISGQANVPKTGGMTVAWIARALSGTRFSVVDSTTDPDRNGTFAEPLPAGSYTSTTGRNPYTADVTQERNGATGPGFFQLDLRLGYRVHPGSGRSLDLFADIFNVTNRANFDNPSGDRFSTNFFNLTTLRAGAVPATLQLGVRFEF
ncbi:MAG TPA: TonB-dependent receptor [Vicinamibacterales bacterium]|nr:TonB-dependent receptor [Vicinamibacterales bacterium]